jgi:hypothetical protein
MRCKELALDAHAARLHSILVLDSPSFAADVGRIC